jgi:hypothetical protein
VNPLNAASLLARFRSHPDESGVWLFREEWPFGPVWALPGGALVDPDIRALFETHRLTMFETLFNPIGALVLIHLGVRRRRWLRANGRRVRKSVWRRAAPAA